MAKNYIFSWFLIDILAVIPFDTLIKDQASAKIGGIQMIKITKLTRLYQVIRFTRMIRLLKMLHIRN